MKQKIVMKVQMSSDKSRTKALKIAVVADGVTSVALEGADKNQVVVIGDGVDSACLVSCLRKKVGYTMLVSVEEVKPKPPEKKPDPKVPIPWSSGSTYIQYPPWPATYEYVCYDPNYPRCNCSIM